MAETPDSVNVEVVREQVDAQVAPPREPDADKVQVHEVSVTLDKVITDPNDPLAVQVPDEVKTELALPIQSLDAPSPEQVLDGAKPAEGQTASNPEETGAKDNAKAAKKS